MVTANAYEARFERIIQGWEAPDHESYGEQIRLFDGAVRRVGKDGVTDFAITLPDGKDKIDTAFAHEQALIDELPSVTTQAGSDEVNQNPVPVTKESPAVSVHDAPLSETESKAIRQTVAWDALSLNTKTAYQKSIKRLADRGVDIHALTDESLSVVITQFDKSGLSHSTLSLTLAAVKWYYKHIMAEDRDWTTTEKRLVTIKREADNQGNGQVDSLDWSDVDVVCRLSALDGSARALRDAALIRLMSDCLLRISEVVAVNVEDVQENVLAVKRSKTDQTGEGATLYIGDETLSLIQRYCEIACITEGALFRRIRRGDHVTTDRLSINGARDAIKAAATLAGISPKKISGHSLRVGSAVSLAKAGASVVEMQQAGRWKSPQMPAHYARAQEAERGAVARLRYGKKRR